MPGSKVFKQCQYHIKIKRNPRGKPQARHRPIVEGDSIEAILKSEVVYKLQRLSDRKACNIHLDRIKLETSLSPRQGGNVNRAYALHSPINSKKHKGNIK